MINIAGRLDQLIKAAGVAITGIAVGDPSDKATWTVRPSSLQSAAQPIIDSFNPNDPSHESAELDMQVKQSLDQDRLISAVLWAILDTYAEFKPATIPKYNAARTKVISAYKTTPWKP